MVAGRTDQSIITIVACRHAQKGILMAERIGGHLTFEALRTGLREQYAVRRSYGTVVIELALDLDRIIVTSRITKVDETSTSTARSFTHLGEAHREYRRLVRSHP